MVSLILCFPPIIPQFETGRNGSSGPYRMMQVAWSPPVQLIYEYSLLKLITACDIGEWRCTEPCQITLGKRKAEISIRVECMFDF